MVPQGEGTCAYREGVRAVRDGEFRRFVSSPAGLVQAANVLILSSMAGGNTPHVKDTTELVSTRSK